MPRCPVCKKNISLIRSTWGEEYAVCECGIRPKKDYNKYMKSAVNPFARWEI